VYASNERVKVTRINVKLALLKVNRSFQCVNCATKSLILMMMMLKIRSTANFANRITNLTAINAQDHSEIQKSRSAPTVTNQRECVWSAKSRRFCRVKFIVIRAD
jgi:hypothetical protein